MSDFVLIKDHINKDFLREEWLPLVDGSSTVRVEKVEDCYYLIELCTVITMMTRHSASITAVNIELGYLIARFTDFFKNPQSMGGFACEFLTLVRGTILELFGDKRSFPFSDFEDFKKVSGSFISSFPPFYCSIPGVIDSEIPSGRVFNHEESYNVLKSVYAHQMQEDLCEHIEILKTREFLPVNYTDDYRLLFYFLTYPFDALLSAATVFASSQVIECGFETSGTSVSTAIIEAISLVHDIPPDSTIEERNLAGQPFNSICTPWYRLRDGVNVGYNSNPSSGGLEARHISKQHYEDTFSPDKFSAVIGLGRELCHALGGVEDSPLTGLWLWCFWTIESTRRSSIISSTRRTERILVTKTPLSGGVSVDKLQNNGDGSFTQLPEGYYYYKANLSTAWQTAIDAVKSCDDWAYLSRVTSGGGRTDIYLQDYEDISITVSLDTIRVFVPGSSRGATRVSGWSWTPDDMTQGFPATGF